MNNSFVPLISNERYCLNLLQADLSFESYIRTKNICSVQRKEDIWTSQIYDSETGLRTVAGNSGK